MRLNQLHEVDVKGFEQSVQSLFSRYTNLFGHHPLTEQDVDWHVIIQALKHALLQAEHTDYHAIDAIMKSICAHHACDTHKLHDQFVNAEAVTPDEWIHTQRS